MTNTKTDLKCSHNELILNRTNARKNESCLTPAADSSSLLVLSGHLFTQSPWFEQPS